MSLFRKILGPKSKYDKSLPYTYEARVQIIEGDKEYNSYFSDTVCGLIEHLHQKGIMPDQVRIFEVFQGEAFPIEAKLYTSPDNNWIFKPEVCESFKEHYPGHIHEGSCSFEDRDRKVSGP